MRGDVTRRPSWGRCSGSPRRARPTRGRYRLFAATRTPCSRAWCVPWRSASLWLLLAVRPRPTHRSGRGLERARPLSRGVHAEARDRGRAAARAPRRPRSRDSLRRAAVADAVYSDDRAANELLEVVGGSTSGGSTRVNAMMPALRLADSDMYGGYLIEDSLLRRAIPLEIVRPPSSARPRPHGTWPGLSARSTWRPAPAVL